MNTATVRSDGGTIVLLDLPMHTNLILDASEKHTLKDAEPMLTICGIVPRTGFHLLTVRGGTTSRSSTSTFESNDSENDRVGNEKQNCRSSRESDGNVLHSVGIVILYPALSETTTVVRDAWFVAKRFDPSTEEISGIDNLSLSNLRNAMDRACCQGNGATGMMSRVVPYYRFMAGATDVSPRKFGPQPPGGSSPTTSDWSNSLTNLIDQKVLARHGLSGRGDKIIPGSYQDYTDAVSTGDMSGVHNVEDGIHLSYPPTPCMEVHHQNRKGKNKNDSGLLGLRHVGTRRYLSTLSSEDRTSLFRGSGSNLGSDILRRVLGEFYGSELHPYGSWKILLGEWQLSFVVFLCCGCLSSLEHWRDMLAMLSMVQIDAVDMYPQLYEQLLISLKSQFLSFETDIFEELELSEGNFILPALQRIYNTCLNSNNENVCEKVKELAKVANDCFLYDAAAKNNGCDKKLENSGSEEDMEDSDEDSISLPIKIEHENLKDILSKSAKCKDECLSLEECSNYDSEIDDDGPVIVPLNEVEISLARVATNNVKCSTSPWISEDATSILQYKKQYPLLCATKTAKEDILMVCARILDDANDVSLVREAADYLDKVEAKRCS